MAKASLEDWMETPLIKNRGRFAAALVKNKSWFGMNSCFRSLIADWTIQEEKEDCDYEMRDDDDEEDGNKAEPDPKLTKSELYKMYSGRGPTKMFADFMGDRTLQLDAIIIVAISSPLEAEYSADLEAQRSGAAGLAEWAATRSSGSDHWW
ncbi:unnamed protein product, partial [Polarella glacialis]